MTALAEVWDGDAAIEVGTPRDGLPSYDVLRSSGSLAVRTVGDDVWIVGAGAHPIGGDRLRLGVRVGAGATLRVRSVSATLARASVTGAASRMDVEAVVADRGTLHWTPAPGVAAAGSRHVSTARVSLHRTSRLCWTDTVVLGRFGEGPGSWSSRLRVSVEGRPLLVSELALGPAHPAWRSAAVLGGARCASSVFVVDPRRPAPEVTLTGPGPGYAVPVGTNALQCVAWGDTFTTCQDILAALCGDQRISGWLGRGGPQDPLK